MANAQAQAKNLAKSNFGAKGWVILFYHSYASCSRVP